MQEFFIEYNSTILTRYDQYPTVVSEIKRLLDNPFTDQKDA